VLKDVRVLYSDGSGGPALLPKGRPVCGSGAAAVDFEYDDDGAPVHVKEVGIMSTLVQLRQSVPRAEVWAIASALNQGAVTGKVDVRPDASYAVDGIVGDEGARSRRRQGANGDVWEALDQAVDENEAVVEVKRVPAHAEMRDLVAGAVSVEDYIGNALADAAAGAVAYREAFEDPCIKEVAQWETRAFMIARRIAVLEARAWGRRSATVPEPLPLEPYEPPLIKDEVPLLLSRISEKGHRLIRVGKQLQCVRCRLRAKEGNWKRWTEKQCDPRARGLASSSSHAGIGGPSMPDQQAQNRQELSQQGSVQDRQELLQQEQVQGRQELSQQEQLQDRQELSQQGGGKRHFSSFVRDHPTNRISVDKRRRVVAEQRREVASRRAQDEAQRHKAWEAARVAIPCAVWEAMEGTDDAEGRDIHQSHSAILCGGFAGCFRCGAVVGYKQCSKLQEECRGFCPKGSRGCIVKLAAGKLPHVQRGGKYGQTWPSGEVDPRPRAFRRST
jgi:hypothetical protein